MSPPTPEPSDKAESHVPEITLPTEDVLSAIEEKVWRNMATNIALPRLTEIINESENDATVVKAIGIVLDRALGKPTEHIDLKTRFAFMPPETVSQALKALRESPRDEC